MKTMTHDEFQAKYVNQIICGDCLDVMAEMPDGCVDAIVTDPPYGIDYQSAWRTDKASWKPKIANDRTPCVEWLEAVSANRLACFCRWDVEGIFRAAIADAGYRVKSQVIWDKEVHGMGDLNGEFAPQHENIIYATKERWLWPGARPKSVLRVQRVMPDVLVHPNEKPVQLMLALVSCLKKTFLSALSSP